MVNVTFRMSEASLSRLWPSVTWLRNDAFLKLSEGMAKAMTSVLKMELMNTFLGRAALLFGRRSFENFRRKLDYEGYGGAPLLGINGVGIVCHGGSTGRAIKNAIKLAARYINNRVLEKMVLQLSDFRVKEASG